MSKVLSTSHKLDSWDGIDEQQIISHTAPLTCFLKHPLQMWDVDAIKDTVESRPTWVAKNECGIWKAALC